MATGRDRNDDSQKRYAVRYHKHRGSDSIVVMVTKFGKTANFVPKDLHHLGPRLVKLLISLHPGYS